MSLLKKHKRNLHKILMISGIAILIIFTIVTKVLGINTQNTWAAYLGLLLFGIPFLAGAWIYSSKIKAGNKIFSLIVKGFVLWYSLTLYVFFNIYIVQKLRFIIAPIWVQYSVVILMAALILSFVLFMRKRKRGNINKEDSYYSAQLLSGFFNYFKSMNNKFLRFTVFVIGILLLTTSVVFFVTMFNENHEIDMVLVLPIHYVGLVCLGIFLLLVSKDIKAQKKNLSLILKIIALYWIIFGGIVTVIGLIQAVF